MEGRTWVLSHLKKLNQKGRDRSHLCESRALKLRHLFPAIFQGQAEVPPSRWKSGPTLWSQTTVRVPFSEFLHSFIHYHNLSFVNSCIHSKQMFINHLLCVGFCEGRKFTWLWTLHSPQDNDLHIVSTQHTLLTKMHFCFLILFSFSFSF